MYNADFGLICVSNEVINGGSGWVTHTADWDSGTGAYVLNRTGTAPIVTPGLGTSIVDYMTGTIPDRKYTMPGVFEAKIYQDSVVGQENQYIILSRGISGNATYLIASKMSAESLYQYFYFTPGSKTFGWANWDAQGGKLHANGNIYFGEWSNLSHIGGLSTGSYFINSSFGSYANEMIPNNNCTRTDGGTDNCRWDEYFIEKRPPFRYPVTYKDPDTGATITLKYTAGDKAGQDVYYNYPEGYAMGSYGGLFMKNTGAGNTYIPCNNVTLCILPVEDETFNGGNQTAETKTLTATVGKQLYTIENFYQNGVGTGKYPSSGIKIQGCSNPSSCSTSAPYVQVPPRLDTLWDWSKYGNSSTWWWDWDNDGANEGQTFTPVYRKQDALNTGTQAADWQNWLNQNPSLQDILQDANTGGQQIAAIKINTQTYFDKAKENGIYIFEDPDNENKLTLSINGLSNKVVEDEDGKFIKDGEEIAQKDWFVNTNSTNKKDLIRVDVANLKKAGATPNNGIIYADYDVLLENAQTLFDENEETGYNGGLTTVGSQNVYLKGDYNTTGWKPSAVITAQYVYVLSDQFGFPKDLLATEHNINYPYYSNCAADNSCPPSGALNPWAVNSSADEAAWIATYASQMPNLVDKNYEYAVSIVGTYVDSIQILERWKDSSGAGKSRTIKGSQVILPSGNFQWPGYPSMPATEWDWSQGRYCSDARFQSGGIWAGKACRDNSQAAGYPSWGGSFVYHGSVAFKFEDRYDVADSSTLPPGSLAGYASGVTLYLRDNVYNFTHHPTQLN
jgi:hypothetical protein